MMAALSRSWRLILPAVLAGLLAGVWIGARCERAAMRRMRRQGPDPERVVKRFRRELALSEAQAGEIFKLLEARRGRFLALRQEGERRSEALRADVDRDIEKVLDEPQKKKFAAMRERRRKERDAAAPKEKTE